VLVAAFAVLMVSTIVPLLQRDVRAFGARPTGRMTGRHRPQSSWASGTPTERP
jgi:hypothetical protein